jgi:hypothetical protein
VAGKVSSSQASKVLSVSRIARASREQAMDQHGRLEIETIVPPLYMSASRRANPCDF